jgi:hypothetical protein
VRSASISISPLLQIEPRTTWIITTRDPYKLATAIGSGSYQSISEHFGTFPGYLRTSVSAAGTLATRVLAASRLCSAPHQYAEDHGWGRGGKMGPIRAAVGSTTTAEPRVCGPAAAHAATDASAGPRVSTLVTRVASSMIDEPGKAFRGGSRTESGRTPLRRGIWRRLRTTRRRTRAFLGDEPNGVGGRSRSNMKREASDDADRAQCEDRRPVLVISDPAPKP